MESERENSAGAKLVITVSMVVENRIHYFLCPHVLTRTDTHITTQLGTEITWETVFSKTRIQCSKQGTSTTSQTHRSRMISRKLLQETRQKPKKKWKSVDSDIREKGL